MRRGADISRSTRAGLVWVSVWVILGLVAAGRARSAAAHLRHVSALDFFDLNGLTREARDFQWALRVPGAEGRFSSLVNEDSPSARVLGACGLYLIRSDRFESARARLSAEDSEVTTAAGCLRFSRPMRELAADLPAYCPHLVMNTSQWTLAEVGALIER